MKITVRTGLVFALVWILFKMILLWTGAFRYNIVPPVLFNMLCLLLAISVGLYLHKRKEGTLGNALNDIKNGLSAGMPYAIIVSVFIYFYYDKIDPEFNGHQIAEAHQGIKEMLDDPDNLTQLREENAEFEVKTKEEIFESLKQGPENFYNAGSTMTLSLLAMLILGTLNSIFITIIYRKVVFRDLPR